MRVLLVYPNLPLMLVPPLSIGLFTRILKEEGHEVGLFDTTEYGDEKTSFHSENRAKFLQARNVFSQKNLSCKDHNSMIEDFKQKLDTFKPQLLLYSSTEDTFKRALELMRISNPYKIPTVIGGVVVTADPEWVISFPEVSMIGIGEGEEVVREISYRIANNIDLSDTLNLWIKKEDKVIRNPMRPYVNLDNYLPDFSLFDPMRFERPMGGKMHISIPIETYRGCPHNCGFCNSPMHNKMAKSLGRVYLRRKSTKAIKENIELLKKTYGVNLLYFTDDSFLARPKQEIDDFIEMYKQYKIPFWFNTRPEHCTLNTLKRLKEVGLFRVSFGIESGNEEFRRKYLNRQISNEALKRCFEIIYKSKVEFSVNFIIGFPYETRNVIFDGIRLAKFIKGCDSLTINIFTPYRGTPLRELAISANFLDKDSWTAHFTEGSNLHMPQLPPQQIKGLLRTFPLYVEFDESKWNEIEKAEQFTEEGDGVFNKYSDLYKERKWGVK
jgi:anaerobic magnesium-protoporphyrin IX monomethyl ester cyclase